MNKHHKKRTQQTLAALTLALTVSAPLAVTPAQASKESPYFTLSPDYLKSLGGGQLLPSASPSASQSTAASPSSAPSSPSASPLPTFVKTPKASAPSQVLTPTPVAPSSSFKAPAQPAPVEGKPGQQSPSSSQPQPTESAQPTPSSSPSVTDAPGEPPSAEPSAPRLEKPTASPTEDPIAQLAKTKITLDSDKVKPGEQLTGKVTDLPQNFSAEVKLVEEYRAEGQPLTHDCQYTPDAGKGSITCDLPEDFPSGAYRLQVNILDADGKPFLIDGQPVSLYSDRVLVSSVEGDYKPTLTPNFSISTSGSTMKVTGDGYQPGSIVELTTQDATGNGVTFTHSLNSMATQSSTLELVADEQGNISTYVTFSPYMASSQVVLVATDTKTGIRLHETVTVIGTSVAELNLSRDYLVSGKEQVITLSGSYFAPFYRDYPVEIQLLDAQGTVITSGLIPVTTSGRGQRMGSFAELHLVIPANFAVGDYLLRAVVPDSEDAPANYRNRPLAERGFKVLDAAALAPLKPTPSPSAPLPSESASPSTAPEPDPSASAEPSAEPLPEPTESAEPSLEPQPDPSASEDVDPSASPSLEASPEVTPEPSPEVSLEVSLEASPEASTPEAEPSEEALFAVERILEQDSTVSEPTLLPQEAGPSATPSPLIQQPVWLQTSTVSPLDPRVEREVDQQLKSSVLSVLGAKDAPQSGVNSSNPFSRFAGSNTSAPVAAGQGSGASVIVTAGENSTPLVPIALLVIAALGVGIAAGAAVMRSSTSRS